MSDKKWLIRVLLIVDFSWLIEWIAFVWYNRFLLDVIYYVDVRVLSWAIWTRASTLNDISFLFFYDIISVNCSYASFIHESV